MPCKDLGAIIYAYCNKKIPLYFVSMGNTTSIIIVNLYTHEWILCVFYEVTWLQNTAVVFVLCYLIRVYLITHAISTIFTFYIDRHSSQN